MKSFLDLIFNSQLLWFQQAKRFLGTGLFCTGMDFIVYWTALFSGTEVYLARFFGAVVGTILSYLINSRFTFQKGYKNLGQASKFLGVYLFNIFNNVSLNGLLINHFGKDKQTVVLAFVFVAGICAIVTFSLNKLFVFKSKSLSS